MKYVLLMGLGLFASCASSPKNWDAPENGVPANLANDSYKAEHAGDSKTSGRRGLTDEELLEFAAPEKEKPWRLSGQLSIGFWKRL